MENILKERQIDSLLHFTRADNLPNIIEYGLLSRADLDLWEIESIYNDKVRYDKCKNAICMSIEFPNYKMFYSLRLENPGTDWVVLLLNAKILLDFDCAFCHTNAGSSEVFNIPLTQRKGKKAFMKLYEELPNGPTRNELRIGEWLPTNPQAEVLVFERIPISYIDIIYFERESVLTKYKNVIPKEISTEVDRDKVSWRHDYKYW